MENVENSLQMIMNCEFISRGQQMYQKAQKMNTGICCGDSHLQKAYAYEAAAKQLKTDNLFGESAVATQLAADAFKNMGEELKAATLYEEAINLLIWLQKIESQKPIEFDKNIKTLIQNAKICYLRAGQSFSAANVILKSAINDTSLMREAMDIFLNEKSPMHAIQTLDNIIKITLFAKQYGQTINVLTTRQTLYEKAGLGEQKHDQTLLQKAILFKLLGDKVGIQQQCDQVVDENSTEKQLINAILNDDFVVIDELYKTDYVKFILQGEFVIALKEVKDIVQANEEEKNRGDVFQVQEIL